MAEQEFRKRSGFDWTPKRQEAAVLLAEAYTVREVAEKVGVTERAIYKWKANVDFAAEVDRLSLMVGIASRAERLRIAMKVVRQKVSDTYALTEKDLLDWLKFAQGETDGIKLDLASLLAATTPVADSGSD